MKFPYGLGDFGTLNYGLRHADRFDALFGGLAIGRDPTPLHNRYVVMKWDFSLVIPQLAQRFGIAEVLAATKDRAFMASLLYFFGILTLAGQGALGKTILRIPNLVARALYVEQLRVAWRAVAPDR